MTYHHEILQIFRRTVKLCNHNKISCQETNYLGTGHWIFYSSWDFFLNWSFAPWNVHMLDMNYGKFVLYKKYLIRQDTINKIKMLQIDKNDGLLVYATCVMVQCYMLSAPLSSVDSTWYMYPNQYASITTRMNMDKL